MDHVIFGVFAQCHLAIEAKDENAARDKVRKYLGKHPEKLEVFSTPIAGYNDLPEED